MAAVRGPSSDGAPGVSVSAGAASIQEGVSPAGVMRHADLALHRAKRAGGDRYAASDDSGEPRVPAAHVP